MSARLFIVLVALAACRGAPRAPAATLDRADSPATPAAVEAAPPSSPGPSAQQVRARMSALRAACRDREPAHACWCEQLCVEPFTGVTGDVLMQYPLGPTSGMSERGPVPIGPVFEFHLGPDGAVHDCGVAPELHRCPARTPELDPAWIGYWQDPASDLPATLADDDLHQRVLWLRPDGTYVRGEPGWSVGLGEWQRRPDGLSLHEHLHVRGWGGGVRSDETGEYVTGIFCSVRPRQPALRTLPVAACDPAAGESGACLRIDGRTYYRAPAPTFFDERFFHRACARAGPT